MSLIRKALRIQRQRGTRALVRTAFDYSTSRILPRIRRKRPGPLNPVLYALAFDWRFPARPNKILRQRINHDRMTLNWVIPTVGSGGGHLNIFRFIRYLQSRGHEQRIIEMTVDRPPRNSSDEVKALIRDLYDLDVQEVSLDFENMQPADATFATSWHTAYPVFKFAETRQAFYFVQDFEPLFAPAGTESALIENTYRFGFCGITAGRWLSHKLCKEFGMECHHYNLAVDHGTYFPQHRQREKKIFFYARPVTPRRGFDLGLRALQIFHDRNPDYEIVFAGGDASGRRVDLPATSVGYLDEPSLNDLYNRCAAALVISLTNCSLLPLDIMATGCPVVTNIGDNTEMVLPPDSGIHVIPSPYHLAEALEKVVGEPPPQERLIKTALLFSWDEETRRVEAIIKHKLGAT